MASSIGRNSTLKISSRQGTDVGVKYEEKDNQEDEVEEQEESTDEDDEEQETRYADEEDQEDDSVELKMKPAKPKPKPIDSAPAPIEVPEEKEDIFFTQYGGDIEYFFPLLSFGIPFDGEITLLGFHGFRGLFPY
ncbi:unnamed protein product [Orchesella dallaii]|uniref:Uncharacterized protein n=1 Tax=Orchesella dallaii TaxID=48710 RepID=A0ABP1Q3V5_9HEXA